MDLRRFLEQAPDGVLVVDRADRIVYWNDSATEILGHERSEVLGEPCHAVLKGMGERGTVVCGPECSLKSCAFRGEKIHNFNLLTTHRDGRTVWLNMSTMCATDFEGRDMVVVHMFRDIDRLHRADELLGEFMVRAAEVAAPVPLPVKASSRGELTAREEEVLTMLGEGLSARAIAEKLVISEATARNHIQSILQKLGVHSRLEAALYARERLRQ
jgi:PAS domain S-box-containing protein